MGIIKNLLSTTDTITDKLDDWRFTDEERSRVGLEWVRLTANRGYNLARRYIALVWILTTLAMTLATFGCIAIGYEAGEAMKEFLVEMMKAPTMMIMTFYYGPGILNKLMQKNK